MKRLDVSCLGATLWAALASAAPAHSLPAAQTYHQCVSDRVVGLAAEDERVRPEADKGPASLAALAMSSCSSVRETLKREMRSYYGDQPAMGAPAMSQVEESLKNTDVTIFVQAVRQASALPSRNSGSGGGKLPGRRELLEPVPPVIDPYPQAHPRPNLFGVALSDAYRSADRLYKMCLIDAATRIAADERDLRERYRRFSGQCKAEEAALASSILSNNNDGPGDRTRAHAWLVQRVAEVRSDRVVFILDPSPPASWQPAVVIDAREVKVERAHAAD